jgi:hypothetical protein
MSKVTVQVTQEDIDNGHPSNPHGCPVALAMNRAFNRTDACAGQFRLSFHASDGANFVVDWLAPPEIFAFISDFDYGHPVEPFEFELEAI